jgi:putative membrane protein
MKKLSAILFAAALTAVTAQPSRAAENVASRDAHFIKKAAEGNNAEIQMGQMVSQRTQDPAVRAYADMIVRDHTMANQQLQQIAQAKGVEFPDATKKSDSHEMTKLEKKSGPELDRAAVDHWVKDHKKDIKEYESQIKNGHDADVRQYASSTLPKLQDHLSRAEALSSKKTVHEPAGSQVHRGDYINP